MIQMNIPETTLEDEDGGHDVDLGGEFVRVEVQSRLARLSSRTISQARKQGQET